MKTTTGKLWKLSWEWTRGINRLGQKILIIQLYWGTNKLVDIWEKW